MSFGFSVGDIILLSQLSYRLYGVLSIEREAAPTHLRELSTCVFGLHRTLDHLSKHISSRQHAPQFDKLQTGLQLMLVNCRVTLEDLDCVLKKYEGKIIANGNGSREKIKREWYRVMWAREEKSLLEIHGRVQRHMVTVSLAVDTFILGEVQDGRDEAAENALKTETMLKQIIDDAQLLKDGSSTVEGLLKQISEDLKLHKKETAKTESIFKAVLDEKLDQVVLDVKQTLTASHATFGMQQHGAQMCFRTMIEPSMRPPPAPSVGRIEVRRMAASASQNPGLDEINKQRAAAARIRSHHVPMHAPGRTQGFPGGDSVVPSFGSPPHHGETFYHVKALSPSEWLDKCDAKLNTWTAPTSPDETKKRIAAAVQLVAELNSGLGSLPNREERTRFRAVLEAGGRFDRVVRNMKTSSKGSVMLRKELEVYEGDKEDDEE